MFNIHEIKDKLPDTISQKVLSNFGQKLTLTGLICYGSRVTGSARKNSDLDMIAVIETDDKSEFYGEYHGTIPLDEDLLAVEIRVYCTQKLHQLLDGDDPKRLFALESSLIIFDSSQELQSFTKLSSQKYKEIIENFESEVLSLNPDEIIPTLQIAASEQFTIIRDLFDKTQHLAAFTCFSELLIDYIVCTEACKRILGKSDGKPLKDSTISNLYFLRSDKGGRFLNFEKYEWPASCENLIFEINSAFSKSTNPIEDAFRILDRHFSLHFNKTLIVSQTSWPSVWLN
jgi:predicted nucleotidyltransferase